MLLWEIVLSLFLGAALAIFFLGGLYATVRSTVRHGHLGLLLMSFLGRSFILLAAFYAFGGMNLERLLAAMTGFWVTRTFFLHYKKFELHRIQKRGKR